jgi:two-component system C4-dicarboxylate transport response regulator DctD
MAEYCILIIEDQEDLVELYKATLKKAGYKVRIALTGEEGIAEFRADSADVILLDMTLPEMHGLQVLAAIRALNASVPIIIISGEDSTDLRAQAQRLGVHEYLTKPSNKDVILNAVARAINAPAEEVELVTLRLPTRIIQQLTTLDPNLEQAIIRLCDGKLANATNSKG